MNDVKILSLSYGNFVSLDDYVKLQQENQQLKEQLKNLEFKYQARSDRLNKKIKQRDEVIDELKEFVKRCEDRGLAVDRRLYEERIKEILTKYKGDNNE